MRFDKHDYVHDNNYAGYPNPLARTTSPSHEKPLLIAFTGRLGAGKSTAAAYIRQQYGGVKLPLARALKLEVYDFLAAQPKESSQVTLRQLEQLTTSTPTFDIVVPKLVLPSDAEKVSWIESNKSTLRPLLQWYGTEFRRAQNPNYWIDQTLAAVEKARLDECVITVDDMRFHNEAHALADVGFNIVKLTVADDERVKRVFKRDGITISPNDTHSSELETDTMAFHYVVENSNEPFEMNRQLDAIVLQILNSEG